MPEEPFQLLPPLNEVKYAALRADIEAAGIRVPIDVDENGTVLNGHHRKAIALELGIPCPVRVVAGLTEEQKREHALSVNMNGRDLSQEQTRELIKRELEHDPNRSDRKIAMLCGTTNKTVGKVRRRMAGEESPHPKPPHSAFEPYVVHPYLDSFPWVAEELFASIADSIRRDGLCHPITLTHDGKTLVDGRIRLLACRDAGVEPEFETLPETYTEDDILQFIYDMNVLRYHYTAQKRAGVMARLEALTAGRTG